MTTCRRCGILLAPLERVVCGGYCVDCSTHPDVIDPPPIPTKTGSHQ